MYDNLEVLFRQRYPGILRRHMSRLGYRPAELSRMLGMSDRGMRNWLDINLPDIPNHHKLCQILGDSFERDIKSILGDEVPEKEVGIDEILEKASKLVTTLIQTKKIDHVQYPKIEEPLCDLFNAIISLRTQLNQKYAS